MVAWELAAVIGSLFIWGIIRGTAVCVSVCVPGMMPYLAERPRSPMEGAKFGLLLCLPRMVIFAAIGFIWGAVSFAIFSTTAFEDAAEWVYILGYMVLGGVIAVLGVGMFLKAARAKDDLRKERLRAAEGTDGSSGISGDGSGPEECPSPGEHRDHKLSRGIASALLRFVPDSAKGERTFVLIWGSILGFTCLLEVSILEVGLLGGAAAAQGQGTLIAAMLGATALLMFAMGATVPVVVASSAFAAYVGRMDTQEKLISLRVTASLVMVLIGGILFLRYLLVALSF
jgi:hypothetical protein